MITYQKQPELNNSNGFLVAIGQQGSGKTAFITSLIVNEYKTSKRLILSNYTLGVPHIKIDLQNILNLITSKELIEVYELSTGEIIEVFKQYKQITGKEPLTNSDYLNNSIIALDEIHIYFDAYDFLTKDNRIISAFASQLRKRNTLLLATTQYFLTISIRLRKQAKYIFDIKQLKNGFFSTDISRVDGYYTDYIKTLTLDLKPYFTYYNTYEIINPI